MTLWELIEVDAAGKATLELFVDATQAVVAYAGSPHAASLQLVTIRTTRKSKDLALARSSHYLEARPVPLDWLTKPARASQGDAADGDAPDANTVA
ncbi:MAG: hypothetical protein NVS2B17_31070 [Candidatus Velthaea sp.]